MATAQISFKASVSQRAPLKLRAGSSAVARCVLFF
jgi:hypothetical protein